MLKYTNNANCLHHNPSQTLLLDEPRSENRFLHSKTPNTHLSVKIS